MAAAMLQRLTSVAIRGTLVASRGFRPVQSYVRHFSGSVRLLADRLYTEKHEWIQIESNVGTVGISEHAQSELGDIVFVELPDVGQEVTKDDEIATIESVKAASDIYSPMSGKVQSVNQLLANSPGLINESPYDKGWIYKLELSRPAEQDGLLSEEAYKKLLE